LHGVILRTSTHSLLSSSDGLACWCGAVDCNGVAWVQTSCRVFRLIWRKLLPCASDKLTPGNLDCGNIKVLAPSHCAYAVLRKQSAAISTQRNAYCDAPSTNQCVRVERCLFGPSTCVQIISDSMLSAYWKTHPDRSTTARRYSKSKCPLSSGPARRCRVFEPSLGLSCACPPCYQFRENI